LANLLGDEGAQLLPKTSAWSTCAILARKEPRCRLVDQEGPIPVDVGLKLLTQMCRKLGLDDDIVLGLTRGNAKEPALANEEKVLVETEARQIGGAERDVEEDRDGDGEFHPHRVATQELGLAVRRAENALGQLEKGGKLFEVGELT
jgi:hypothetical protein